MTERPSGLGNGASFGPDEADRRGEIARLLAQLAAPRGSPPMDVPPGRRRLSPLPPMGLISAILAEVDATVMARCLVFRADNGAALHLDVCNRRLLHFAEAGGDPRQGPDGAVGLAGTMDMEGLIGALDRISTGGAVSVEALPPSDRVCVEVSGVSVPTLRNAVAAGAGHDSGARRGAPDLAGFAATCADEAVAWHLLSGASGGNAPLAVALGFALEDWCSTGFAPPAETCATVLTSDAGGIPPVFFGQTPGDVLAMALRPGAEERVLALWLACSRTG